MGAVKRQRQGGAVQFERQRRLVEGAVMDDLVALDVEQRILLRGVQCPLQLPDKRIQRRDDAGLGDRVDPQPVRILDARRACGRVRPSSANKRAQPGGDGSTCGAAAARAAAAENADGLPSSARKLSM